MALILFNLLSDLLSLRLGSLSMLLLSNLHWLFVFAATMHFLLDGKRVLLGIASFIVYLWASIDFGSVVGWSLLAGEVLMLSYMTRFALMLFFAGSRESEKRLPMVFITSFWIILIGLNLGNLSWALLLSPLALILAAGVAFSARVFLKVSATG